MLYSPHCLKSVIFAAVLNYLGEGNNCGNSAATSCTPVPLGQRCSVTAALWGSGFFLSPAATAGYYLRVAQVLSVSAQPQEDPTTPLQQLFSVALWWVVALSFVTLWSCWLESVCHHTALLALPSALGQGEAKALLWYIYVSFISKKSAVHSSQTNGLLGCLT